VDSVECVACIELLRVVVDHENCSYVQLARSRKLQVCLSHVDGFVASNMLIALYVLINNIGTRPSRPSTAYCVFRLCCFTDSSFTWLTPCSVLRLIQCKHLDTILI
jgi:hypothetical protein